MARRSRRARRHGSGSTRRTCRTAGTAESCSIRSTGTLLCGDLFTQPGAETPPITESEILTASEAMRKPMDYYAHSTKTTKILERLASLNPTTLACQHGSAYRGDGAALLRELAAILEKEQRAALA
jgi:hypothetical protein